MVSLPKEANREARFNMAMERARRERPKQAMFVHQFSHCPSIATLADDFLRTPDLGRNAWEFAPDVSTQCEKVMTSPVNKTMCQTSVWHWKLIGRGEGHHRKEGCRLHPPRAKAETRAEQCRIAGECSCGAGGGKRRSFCNAPMKADQISVLGGFHKPNDT